MDLSYLFTRLFTRWTPGIVKKNIYVVLIPANMVESAPSSIDLLPYLIRSKRKDQMVEWADNGKI
jgi:hypothetical protein